MAQVTFWYHTGLTQRCLGETSVFHGRSPLLAGSWDEAGRPSRDWTRSPMRQVEDESGCVAFTATVELDAAPGQRLDWGVGLQGPHGGEVWAIPTEIGRSDSSARFCSFDVGDGAQEVRYRLTHLRWLGANRVRRAGGADGLRFVVWAPNAQAVELVFGATWDGTDPGRHPADRALPPDHIRGGYIADDGSGRRSDLPAIPLTRCPDGTWVSDPRDPGLPEGGVYRQHLPYMYRITREDGSVRYRSDIYSRLQIGRGAMNPRGAAFDGPVSDLSGSVSCSVTVDPDRVTAYLRESPPYLEGAEPVWPERHFIDATEFWRDEFTEGRRPPNRIEDLIIYELHVGALGFGRPGPGTLEDAIGLLDHIAAAGFNAVELLPLAEFAGSGENWGYAPSHPFAIESSAGGRDHCKFFVRECHRRGLAVLLDVVFNHFAHDAERSTSAYDSPYPQNDFYYWYEGHPSQYRERDGGYLDNLSTAYAPRFSEEMVRKMFISSAIALLTEFHVDGFRVDQTTSIHSYNRLHADGRPVPAANAFGGKFLREFGRSLRMVRPDVLLIAEDHSGWEEITRPVEAGGIGFDARWFSDFYHNLAGDTGRAGRSANLLRQAAVSMGRGGLAMDLFASVLAATADRRVVYPESHDEAGNSSGAFEDRHMTDAGKEFTSHRSLVVAANAAPLIGATRAYAEARVRFAWGMTALSAGTPMTLFGEEVGAVKRFKYNAVLDHKEDLLGLAQRDGAGLYAFFREVNALRAARPALRKRQIEILYTHNANRVIAFSRWDEAETYLVVGSLNDRPFPHGYVLVHPRIGTRPWTEVFSSDDPGYGGDGICNPGPIDSTSGAIDIRLPHAGFVVLRSHTA
ncbi:alpha-amylase family glycosyl hydrolase [Tropicimonas sp. IMCC6043]|uniref:alpha-amylase family glycosyl hydrolase n=1 Tax=Tropicimonas sp. IMCC6043 TaxID=2510645 RepID=UPI00101DDB54|nr:alpha-amylase family glycosyl hydrolase [Tropicimonas sp. IMCC6043]RYH09203.1 alpha-amylase [Tropicimonas sp. IMCC6043]